MSEIENQEEEAGAVLTGSTEDEAAVAAEVTGSPVDENATYAGWAYLAFLFALFLVLALFAYSCDGDSSGGNEATPTPTTEAAPDPEPVVELTASDLVYEVSGDSVTLTGSVPDTSARDQLVGAAREVYGDNNVTDQLVIDDGFTLDGGTVTIIGNAAEGDAKPENLAAASSSVGGLATSADGVVYEAAALTPVDAEFALVAGKVALTGVVPDEASRAALIANAEEIYGADNVDASGLTVGDTTWDEGRIRVTGFADPGDNLADDLQALLERDNAGITVENTVEVDTSSDALGRLQERLREELALEPILFASNSDNISSESDETLQRVADALLAVPEVPVAIVGHTDSQGRASSNQQLSEDRANAVLARLVELGVDADRLSASGLGEDEPIADNTTSEGRQANRRIEFLFDGAS